MKIGVGVRYLTFLRAWAVRSPVSPPPTIATFVVFTPASPILFPALSVSGEVLEMVLLQVGVGGKVGVVNDGECSVRCR